MNENEVKTAFDRIEPESGAQERMYANILKKRRHRKRRLPRRKPTRPRQKTMRPQPSYRFPPAVRRRCGSAAARWPRALRWW